ncbi:MAG: hypothetical protein ACI9TF_002006, partial [Paracrocinitomix sp.]
MNSWITSVQLLFVGSTLERVTCDLFGQGCRIIVPS